MKALTRLCLVAVFAAFHVFGVASPSQAYTGTCTHWLSHISQIGYDLHAANARCTWIRPDSKVRATLAIDADWDRHSQWFTKINLTYTSPYNSCAFGCHSRVDFAKRS